jgi:hypothetical protein
MALQARLPASEGLRAGPSEENCQLLDGEDPEKADNLSFPQIWVQSFCQSDCDDAVDADGSSNAAQASSALVVRSLQSFHSLDSQDSGCALSSSGSTRQASFQSSASTDDEAATVRTEDEDTDAFFPTHTSRAVDAWLRQIGINGFDVALLQEQVKCVALFGQILSIS